MQNQQTAAINDLEKYTVGIRTDRSIGTGIIVTDDGLILTCYHVIGDVENNSFYEDIEVHFSTNKVSKAVHVEYSKPELDIAVLRVDEKLPEQTGVAPLSENVIYGHKFTSIGFRKAQQFKKLSTDGVIRITTGLIGEENDEEGKESSSAPLIQLYSNEIEEGMSGAAVLDLETNRVIGILFQHYDTRGTIDTNLNFAIPIESILKLRNIAFILRKNPGLNKISKFLQSIGLNGIKKYERINDLFVSPINYNEIKEELRKNRIVFITGTKEYGKTYVSIMLLWEYFNKGYEPIMFRGDDKAQRIEGRTNLLDIEKNLEDGRIMYIEDPFGKTEYEGDETLRRYISTIIDTIRNLKNVYVIISSRDEVFKNFIPLAEVNLKEFEKKLNIKTPSYNYEKRKEMLLKWAKAMNCIWIRNNNLKKDILEYLRDNRYLPTPLNIEQFARATVTIRNKNELLGRIHDKSKDTAKSFADEIRNMEEEKIMFLSFPFISDHISLDLVKITYKQLIKEIGIKYGFNFQQMLNWFIDDKINVSNSLDEIGKQAISFSHPSYSEALKYILSDSSYPLKAKNILLKTLFTLAKQDYLSRDILRFVKRNFQIIPEEIREQLLLTLASKKLSANDTCVFLDRNFQIIPEEIREQLLLALTDNDSATMGLYWLIKNRFNDMPKSIMHRFSHKASSGRILLVQDDADINFTIKMALEMNGFNIDSYIDPVMALKNFKPNLYDLLFIDLKMPNMNGFELTHFFKEIEESAVICLTTAQSIDFRELDNMNTGIKYFIKFPISITDLLELVNFILNKSTALKESKLST
jgi:CheY-like chemotaxis protein